MFEWKCVLLSCCKVELLECPDVSLNYQGSFKPVHWSHWPPVFTDGIEFHFSSVQIARNRFKSASWFLTGTLISRSMSNFGSFPRLTEWKWSWPLGPALSCACLPKLKTFRKRYVSKRISLLHYPLQSGPFDLKGMLAVAAIKCNPRKILWMTLKSRGRNKSSSQWEAGDLTPWARRSESGFHGMPCLKEL